MKGSGNKERVASRNASYLRSTDGILPQVDAWGLAFLQASRRNLRQQVLQFLIFPEDFHRRHSDGEAGARLLLALIDELEEPGNGTGHNAQTLRAAVFANHGVCLALWRMKRKWRVEN